MDDNLQFAPIFPSHAIERCGATITFSEPLPLKVFQKVLDQVQTSFRNEGLEMIGGAPRAVGFQFDIASGQATPLTEPRPSIFATADRASQFIVAQNSLTARTTSYVRWSPFAGQLEELLLPLIGAYSEIASVVSIQLDYVDRFLWTGDWNNLDWRSLLRPEFLAQRAAETHRQWHTHSGWFEDAGGRRRLVNVNVDLTDFSRSDRIAPSVAILTLMRDEVVATTTGQAAAYDDAASVQAGFEQLHNDLKILLGQIITEPTAQRISLNAQASDATPN